MSPHPSRPPLSLAAAVCVVGLSCTPAAAFAADAPTRYIGINAAGQQARYPNAVAISNDGSEVLMNVDTDRDHDAYTSVIRDVAGGETVPAVPGGYAAFGASDDLQRILVTTTDRLDPADTNTGDDAYVYDRTTGTFTYASRPLTGNTPLSPGYNGGEAFIAPDGTSVIYNRTPDQPNPGTYRYVLATGKVTRLDPTQPSSAQRLDSAARNVVVEDGVLVGARKLPVPAGVDPSTFPGPGGGYYRSSPDGRWIAVASFSAAYESELRLLDTTTGEAKLVPLPISLRQNGVNPLRVENDGRSVLVETTETRPVGRRLVLSRLDTASGTLTQVGGDAPWLADDTTISVLSPDGSFGGSQRYLTAFGSKPIPGVAQPIPRIPAAEYLKFRPGCSYGGFFNPVIKASIALDPAPVGLDTRKPTSALVKVVKTGTADLQNQFTLAPGKRANITAAGGGVTYFATVSFDDGSKATGWHMVDPYTPVKNDDDLFNPGYYINKCGQANL